MSERINNSHLDEWSKALNLRKKTNKKLKDPRFDTRPGQPIFLKRGGVFTGYCFNPGLTEVIPIFKIPGSKIYGNARARTS